MQSTKVTTEELKAKAREVDREADEYYNEYQGLLRDVEEFTSTDWKGEDANLFRDKVKGFEPEFNKMKELMNQYANFLRQSAENYDNRLNNTKNTINSLR